MKNKTKVSIIAGVAISTMSSVSIAEKPTPELVNLNDKKAINNITTELTPGQSAQLKLLTSVEGKAVEFNSGAVIAKCKGCPPTERHADKPDSIWERFLDLFKSTPASDTMIALSQKKADKEFS